MDQGLQSLMAEVEREAREEASRKLERARAAAASILDEARARAEAERRRLLAATDGQIEQIKRRARSSVQLAAEHERQVRREAIIQRVFEDVRKGLAGGLSDADRRASLVKLFEEAAQALDGGPLVVSVAPADMTVVTPGFLKAISRSLSQRGIDSELTVAAEPARILGGVIVSTRDERVSFDNSWEARLQRQMPTLRPLVWRILIGEEQPETSQLNKTG